MRPRGPGWRARRLGCWVCRGAPQELSLEHKRIAIHRILACHRFLQRRKLSCGRFFQCIGEIEIYAQKGAIGDYSHEYDSAPTVPAGPTRPGTAAPSVLTRREPPHNPQGARKCRTVALLIPHLELTAPTAREQKNRWRPFSRAATRAYGRRGSAAAIAAGSAAAAAKHASSARVAHTWQQCREGGESTRSARPARRLRQAAAARGDHVGTRARTCTEICG